MRKFIVSDLHGNGEVYDSIIGYLENISLTEDVVLYINGDLIDRGMDSLRMLKDIKKRIEEDEKIKIKYLGGNHELMMYQALQKYLKKGKFPFFCDWLSNGGEIIKDEIIKDKESMISIVKFIGDLQIYEKFPETMKGNSIVLVHAQAPSRILDKCDLKISDNNRKVTKAVWTRRFDDNIIPHRIGKKGYFTIIGHTPILLGEGVEYYRFGNYLNIDGGCAAYATGNFSCDHVPLVEVENELLTILIFNHNNEIIDGFTFNGKFGNISSKELEKRKLFINHQYNGCGERSKQKIMKKYKK